MAAAASLTTLLALLAGAAADHPLAVNRAHAAAPSPAPASPASTPAIPVPTPTPAQDPQPAPAPAPTPRPLPPLGQLSAQLSAVAQAGGATVGISLVELAGDQPRSWSSNGDQSFVAASTYKLPLLMYDAQGIAGGTLRAGDLLCYTGSDWEDGWFTDYREGDCYTRAELDQRAGVFSDNTAAHILVRYMGGTARLNQYARAHGASGSQLYDPNQTSPNDLARLLADEQAGRAGGPAAQQYLAALLTHTAFEDGVAGGVPPGTTVVHKIGELDQEVNDAALVLNGPQGPYVLVVMVAGGGGDPWSLIAEISRRVWAFEASR